LPGGARACDGCSTKLRLSSTRAAVLVGATLLATGPLAGRARAGVADVTAAHATCRDGTCTLAVTVRHADAGWDHYADRWEVVGPDGKVLATRVLRHPHVDEQPFTRELSGVVVPAAVHRVTIRAHDSVHGWGGAEVTVDLPPH
jgi:hypothetical protein